MLRHGTAATPVTASPHAAQVPGAVAPAVELRQHAAAAPHNTTPRVAQVAGAAAAAAGPHHRAAAAPLGTRPQVAQIAIMDGVTMGGGAGLCMNGPFRVTTERCAPALNLHLLDQEHLRRLNMMQESAFPRRD